MWSTTVVSFGEEVARQTRSAPDLIGLRSRPDGPSQLPRNVQPESEAFIRIRVVFALRTTVERVEDLFQDQRLDRGSVVAHLEVDLRVFADYRDMHGRARRSVLDRVQN